MNNNTSTLLKQFIFLIIIFLTMLKCTMSEPQGKTLYNSKCASCHMEDGSGLELLYPPLAGSDYLLSHQSILACIITTGIKDSIIVNGNKYDEPMLGIPELNSVEITNIINYVNKSWGNNIPKQTLKQIKNSLNNTCNNTPVN